METLSLGSTGPNVMLIQSLLNRLGYPAGAVDGSFGPGTQRAVVLFQRDFGLAPDGIIGPSTWAVMERFLLGYSRYTVRSGETIYSIARRFYTTENAVLTANPGVDPNALSIGQQLIVPYGIDVVYTDIAYTYEILDRQLKGLRARYPFLEISTIGTSVMGKNQYVIRLGRGTDQVSYNAAHHANEWITTPLLMKFVEKRLKSLRGWRPTRELQHPGNLEPVQHLYCSHGQPRRRRPGQLLARITRIPYTVKPRRSTGPDCRFQAFGKPISAVPT